MRRYAASGRFAALFTALATSIILLGCGASSGGASSGGSPSGGKRVAFISAGTGGVGGYEHAHLSSFQAMCAKYHFQCKVIDQVGYGGVAVQTFSRLASSGTNLVVADSSGFASALQQVAHMFPHTWFVDVSNMPAPTGVTNLAGFTENYTQMGYLGGVAAAYLSHSKVYGFANGQPLLVLNQLMGGFLVGARTVAAKSKLLVRNTGSFSDNTLARQASLAEAQQGADVLSSGAGSATPGSIAAAQQAHVVYIGYFTDEYARAPCCVRTSMVADVSRQYDQLGKLYTSHALRPTLYRNTVQNGGIYLAPLRGVAPRIAAKIRAVQAKVAGGRIQVTAKPVTGSS